VKEFWKSFKIDKVIALSLVYYFFRHHVEGSDKINLLPSATREIRSSLWATGEGLVRMIGAMVCMHAAP